MRCQAREPTGLARNAGSTEAVLNPSTTAGSMRLILAGEDATGRKPPAPLRHLGFPLICAFGSCLKSLPSKLIMLTSAEDSATTCQAMEGACQGLV